MKGRLIAAEVFLGRPAAALFVDGRLEDFIVDAPPGGPAPGAVFVARGGRPLKGLGAQMVELGEGRRAFLRGPGQIAQGKLGLVQITAFGEGAKAPMATTRIGLRGIHAVLTPGAPGINVSRNIRDAGRIAALKALGAGLKGLPEDTGLILRSAAAEADDAEIAADLQSLAAALARARAALAAGTPGEVLPPPDPLSALRADWPGPATIDDAPGAFLRAGLDEALRALTAPAEAPGALFVEPTRALVAVDVNTGGDTSPAAGLKANLAAMAELPRRLRILGLGGQVVVDPAPCPKPDRKRITEALTRALKRDPVRTDIAGWTPLGHLELSRQRARYPWMKEHPHGLPDL